MTEGEEQGLRPPNVRKCLEEDWHCHHTATQYRDIAMHVQRLKQTLR